MHKDIDTHIHTDNEYDVLLSKLVIVSTMRCRDLLIEVAFVIR